MTSLRPLHRCGPYNSQVVACDIFATPNSLKSHVGRNLKSLFSNIHAVPFKLCPHSRQTTVQNCLSLGSRVPLKSPIVDRAAPPNTCPSPRFRPLEVFGRRPPCAWKRSSWPASENLHIAGSPCTVYSTAQSPMTRLESRWWSSRTRGEGFLIVDQFLLCFAISNPIR